MKTSSALHLSNVSLIERKNFLYSSSTYFPSWWFDVFAEMSDMSSEFLFLYLKQKCRMELGCPKKWQVALVKLRSKHILWSTPKKERKKKEELDLPVEAYVPGYLIKQWLQVNQMLYRLFISIFNFSNYTNFVPFLGCKFWYSDIITWINTNYKFMKLCSL